MCEYVEQLKELTKDLPSLDKHIRDCCGEEDEPEPKKKDLNVTRKKRTGRE